MTHVAIVGAGPAGLAAAHASLLVGADVTLLDASAGLGGQYWRHLPPSRPAAREGRLHHGWDAFTALAGSIAGHARATIVPNAHLWAIEPQGNDGRLTLRTAVGDADSDRRSLHRLTPDAVVLATGSHDLTLPFPGWDLPGVFTGGAAQALAKSERVAIGKRVVVAGAGPFLLPVAAALTATGARVLGVLEASRTATLAQGWAGGAASVAAMPGKFAELAGYVTGQLRNRIPYRTGTGVIAAHGDERLEAVTVASLDANWAPVSGTERMVECDAVAVSHGFTPRLELPIAAGCTLADAGPWSRFVAVDDAQRTSVPNVYAAGEVTGIGGADAALREGGLAGWIAAGGDPAHRRAVSARRQVARYRTFARALARAHGIRPGWTGWLKPDTIVCRCEEVSHGRIADVVDASGARSFRALKLTTRAGLGPCQGRICGRTVEALVTDRVGAPLDGVVPDRRPIAAPIRFSELAALHRETHHELHRETHRHHERTQQ